MTAPSRTVAALDRTAVLLLGLGLVALGAAAAGWQAGRIEGRPGLPWLDDALDAAWWPAALGGIGVLLVVLGLRWLAAHLPGRRLHELRLPGSGPAGRLQVDPSAVAAAAARQVQQDLGVRSARGRAVQERGRRFVELVVTLEPHGSLTALSSTLDTVLAGLSGSLGPETAVRVRVHAGRSGAVSGLVGGSRPARVT